MCTGTLSRVVTAPGAVETARSLGERQASLAAWYAEPLSVADAARLYAGTEKSLRYRLCTGLPVFQLQVLQLLCHYRMDVPVSLEYQQLAASAMEKHDRALLEIVYGQLLFSCRQRPALQHLDRGFSLAAGYLEATDYFLLVRRHDLLRHIPLADARVAPQGLQSLLAEAAVIRQLRGAARDHCSVSHQDTIG
jgi:hypothetical protein